MPGPPLTLSSPPAFRIRFDSAPELELGMDVLRGEPAERIFLGLREAGRTGAFSLLQGSGLRVGFAVLPASADLATQAHALYQHLLEAVGDRHLARVWNYVPRINEPDATGLESYRAFCKGRSLAFEQRLGGSFRRHLPAASAVGGPDSQLAVVFAATEATPQHVENPQQVPAYDYPPEHGPRPPSFARATRVQIAGRPHVFISGTAAIKGHQTIAEGDLRGQIACMLDNFDVLSRTCGLGDDLGRTSGWERHFKIYLRHAEHLDAAAELIERRLIFPLDHATWLRSDICRSALLIEIEATLIAR